MKKNRIRYIYGDVSDKERCLTASENIDIVIHATAMKHVPFVSTIHLRPPRQT